MALADVTLAASFARFKASMAAFKVEGGLSRTLGRSDVASIVERRGGREEEVRCKGWEEEHEP